jgi:jumonji domain-containing protein 7
MENHTGKCFRLLQRQHRDLYGQRCETIDASELDSFSFLYNYVKQNRPLIIKNLVSQWKALHLWKSNEYLVEKMRDRTLSVAASPTWRVDAVYNSKFFVEPEIRKMSLNSFFHCIADPNRDEILYIQQQNDNLNKEFGILKEDIDVSSLDVLSKAFQQEIDAANIWIGTEDSVSSAHKDHYENLYIQICGRKIFYILPPSAVTQLDIRLYSTAQFKRLDTETRNWRIIENSSNYKVPWTEKDLRKIYESNEDDIYPMKIVLEPGNVLYLPSLWYHQVEQENDEIGRVIAVNFWYDMQYDQNYYYYQLLENLTYEWKREMLAEEEKEEI